MNFTFSSDVVVDFDISIRIGKINLESQKAVGNGREKIMVEVTTVAPNGEAVAAEAITLDVAAPELVVAPEAIVHEAVAPIDESDTISSPGFDTTFIVPLDDDMPILESMVSSDSIPDRQPLPGDRKRPLKNTPIVRREAFKLPRFEYPRLVDGVAYGDVQDVEGLSSKTGLVRWAQNQRYQAKKKLQREAAKQFEKNTAN